MNTTATTTFADDVRTELINGGFRYDLGGLDFGWMEDDATVEAAISSQLEWLADAVNETQAEEYQWLYDVIALVADRRGVTY